jgi:hypothetical protein
MYNHILFIYFSTFINANKIEINLIYFHFLMQNILIMSNNLVKIDIPLEFWFCKGPSKKVLLENENISNDYNALATDECTKADLCKTFDGLVKILDNLHKLENECVTKCLSNILAIPVMHPMPQPLIEYINYVNDLLDKLTPDWYMVSVEMSNGEQFNGYHLYNIKETSPWLRYDYFLKLEKLFSEPNTMTRDEFLKKYDNDASFEWSKFDEQGKYFVGFYKCSEDSYEYKNAYKLTRDVNGNALWNLPYSHALIFETIKYRSGHLQECVRFSNFMCEYISRKLKNKK